MGKSLTQDEFIERLKAVHGDKYIVNGIYKMNKEKIEIHCTVCGSDFFALPNNLLSGKGCRECANKALRDKYIMSQEEFKIKLYEVHKDKYIPIDTYNGSKNKIKFKCNECGNVWSATPDKILQGRGCNKCKAKKIADICRLSLTEFNHKLLNIHNGDITLKGTYKNNKTKSKFKCNCCNHTWMAVPKNILMGKGCPKCASSKGEKKIDRYLSMYNLRTVSEYTFKDCINSKPLPFDFAVFKGDKLVVLIEYDGKHHFLPIDRFGGEDNLQYVKVNDKIKDTYCKLNNIPLIRIPYWDIDDIEKILNEALTRMKILKTA